MRRIWAPLSALAALGVARVSFGSLLMKRALAEAERAFSEYVADRGQ